MVSVLRPPWDGYAFLLGIRFFYVVFLDTFDDLLDVALGTLLSCAHYCYIEYAVHIGHLWSH